ncbi:TonB-dependent receptor plug domain-containing protein [Roseateles albus]|uniref:TonB-dependent receptor n=1 Tax=Roseateles albus TaxID=2987525 RepID=A0ABT5K8Q7_9BURK|nr:TonB-dependent receptor [Roseateles albus]MDC8770268.1 TonB-dependent receptor [Roseateles albus]
MMFLKTHKASAVRLAVIAAMGAMTVSAQAQNAQLERIEVTGSSIKRISSEGALPVQVISAKDIARSGATSVSDVIRNLPAMQGFQIADTAAGTNSGGISTANIHDIGSSYTLVLLNGRRIAPTGDGSTVNLNSIPMSAIDRIEVLTDGASALYGSDAIAGVVNFVLKKNYQGGNVVASGMVPLEGGGKSAYASLTYGIGDIDKDRFNVLMSYRHDQQQQLKATDRAFGSTAYIPFEYGGKQYIYDRTSPSAVPANVTVTAKNGANGKPLFPAYAFNPYAKANGGKCADRNFSNLTNVVGVQETCGFDYANTIEIYPESKRDSLFVSGQFKVNDKLSFYSDVALARFDLTARIAANPVPVAIPTSTDLFAKYVAPYLTPTQIANLSLETDKTSPNFGKPRVTASYRAQDFGTRDSQTITDSKHFVIGAEAELAGWIMNGGLTWSQNSINEKYVGGYFKKNEFISMVQKNQFDPFAEAGKQTPATLQLMADSIYHGTVRNGETTLTGADFRASRELYKLPAGDLSLGLGADIREQQYTNTPTADAVNGVIYNYAAANTFDVKRKSGGVFGELLIPVIKNLELTAALRYDTIKKTDNAVTGKSVGEDLSATTYKISGRYQVVPQVLLRGSYGTGFKAPDMLTLASPLLSNGVTAASFDCPFPGTSPCQPTRRQYSQLAGGNELVKPEKSEQMAFGIRFEPNASFGIGADYYNVYITDAISGVSAAQAFAEPAKFANLFTTYQQPAEDKPYYAFKSVSTNIGRSKNSGIDWDIVGRTNLENLGRLTLGLAGTYVIESSYTLPGTNDQYTNSLGQYNDVSASVTFRNKVLATATLDTGKFTNSFTLNWKSGYKDKLADVRDVATNKLTKVAVDVPRSSTLDWQGVYRHNKAATLTVGVKNLFNREPEFSLRDSSGHQVGYDPRYGDTLQRRVYVTGGYDF